MMQFQSLFLGWGRGKPQVYMRKAHRTLCLVQSSIPRQLYCECGGRRMTGRTLEKCFKAAKDKLEVGIATDGEAKEENSGY